MMQIADARVLGQIADAVISRRAGGTDDARRRQNRGCPV